MQKRSIKVVNKLGLHARASAKLTQVASSFMALLAIPTAAGRNSSANDTCAPMMNDHTPPNLIVPPVPVITCSPRWMDAPVAFSAGSKPIMGAAMRASRNAYATVRGSSARSTQNGSPSNTSPAFAHAEVTMI